MPVFCLVYRKKRLYPCLAESAEGARQKYVLAYQECQSLTKLNAQDAAILKTLERWQHAGQPVEQMDPLPFIQSTFDRHFRIYHSGIEFPSENLKTLASGTVSVPRITIHFAFTEEMGDPVLLFTQQFRQRETNWRVKANGEIEQLSPLICELCGEAGPSLCAECAADIIASNL